MKMRGKERENYNEKGSPPKEKRVRREGGGGGKREGESEQRGGKTSQKQDKWRERQKEGGKGMRREKEDEVGCVWKGGGEESGKAPNVGDARVRDATSESGKGIILKKVGW